MSLLSRFDTGAVRYGIVLDQVRVKEGDFAEYTTIFMIVVTSAVLFHNV